MKKNYLLLSAVAIAMLGSCSDDVMDISMDEALAVKDVPVSFGTYMGKNATTRAGETDPIDLAKLKEANYGFGVFGYDTGNSNYSDVLTNAVRSAKPNFMYNEKVTWNGSNAWTYSPIKYWPNAFAAGNVDNQGATATTGQEHKLSFFAYAPYVDHLAAAGLGSTGITAIAPANNATGDPVITYKLTTDGTPNVDLLWGTAYATNNSVLDGTQAGTKLTGGLAAVNLDLVKQKTEGKVGFSFKHALSNVGGGNSNLTDATAEHPDGVSADINIKQGGLQIMLDVDEIVANTTAGAQQEAGTNKFDVNSRVYVKSIKISGYSYRANDPTSGAAPTANDGTATKIWVADGGDLNLATGIWDPSWTVVNLPGTVPNTIDTEIISDPAPTALTDKQSKLHANIDYKNAKAVDDNQFATNIGVLTKPQNVYDAATAPKPLVFIPNTFAHLKVTVEYVVLTKDAKLADGGTTITQTITKELELGVIEQNKQYNLIIHLGMTSIKFEATVQDWTGTPTGGSDPVNPDPNNPGTTPALPSANQENVPVWTPKNVN